MTKQTKKILPSFAQFGDNRIHFMPKRTSDISMGTYFLALIACTLLYSSHILNWKWWIFGIISVVGFFHFANRQSKLWLNIRPTTFSKRLFWGAFSLRVVWVLISYYLYNQWTGTPFSIGAADEVFYDEVGQYGASLIRDGNWKLYTEIINYIYYKTKEKYYNPCNLYRLSCNHIFLY